jgi:hypothetical protein
LVERRGGGDRERGDAKHECLLLLANMVGKDLALACAI